MFATNMLPIVLMMIALAAGDDKPVCACTPAWSQCVGTIYQAPPLVVCEPKKCLAYPFSGN